MKNPVVFSLPLVFLTACGYIGPPEYPALRIPSRVTDLSVVERGDHLDVNFIVPPLTTEGLKLTAIGAVELRVGPNPKADFRVETWSQEATRIEVPAPAKPGPVEVKVPVGNFVGQEVTVAVRLANPRHRFSEWSNLATVRVEPPLVTPAQFVAENTPEGVRLTWKAPDQPSFKVYRSSEKEPQPALLDTVKESSYLDASTTFGQTYEYFVQGVNGAAESEAAGPVSVTTKDVFPPAIPAGVAATAGLNAIELAWMRNAEPDFRGYRVYRATGDGPFQLIADRVDAPNYSDRQIETGKRYRYQVSAVDQAGNESEKSPPVEALAP